MYTSNNCSASNCGAPNEFVDILGNSFLLDGKHEAWTLAQKGAMIVDIDRRSRRLAYTFQVLQKAFTGLIEDKAILLETAVRVAESLDRQMEQPQHTEIELNGISVCPKN